MPPPLTGSGTAPYRSDLPCTRGMPGRFQGRFSGTKTADMDRLTAALERLTRAIDTLDQTVVGHLKAQPAQGDLLGRLASAEASERRSRSNIDAVAARLDRTIGRLKAVLEE